jgi:hypothetical protein
MDTEAGRLGANADRERHCRGQGDRFACRYAREEARVSPEASVMSAWVRSVGWKFKYAGTHLLA